MTETDNDLCGARSGHGIKDRGNAWRACRCANFMMAGAMKYMHKTKAGYMTAIVAFCVQDIKLFLQYRVSPYMTSKWEWDDRLEGPL